jgi:hypothetical protein
MGPISTMSLLSHTRHMSITSTDMITGYRMGESRPGGGCGTG